MIYFKQCVLHRKNQTQVAWLPEMYAKIGGFVELELNGKWENGWKVLNVGKSRMTAEDVSKQSQEYKHQRKASDI